MPAGKRAGEPCLHLDAQMRCRLFGQPERPAFCAGLSPSPTMCGEDREQALAFLSHLEQATRPD